ncbi:hypothetical protein D9V37_08880 [Nocardioides mangrovicus]|uniref:Heme-binding protein n=1 Tax=Nocardioides mangrovicus TaxID=2478913 RepID=A0A3L8P3F8_9ACTN|nr:heme-binding protein [Nocardioides mangrovicus]RLV49976.1 hypothetical protein D9V37_08880 [Nocardioides mangrovicus]
MAVPGGRTTDLDLASARSIVERAIDKGEQLGLRGGFAVVGASGALVTASRMDRGGAGGMARARSKAWISATQQIPSFEHLQRMGFVGEQVANGFKQCSPEARFPGAGGMPIRDPSGAVVAGVAASGATVSPFFPTDIAQENMIADGKPANPEDLVVHYAMGLPYVGQHGDDHKRWEISFGPFPDDPPAGRGNDPAPVAADQPEHRWAVSLADAVMERAQAAGVLVAISVVDHRGDPVQQDVMDGAPTAATFLADGVAAAAALMQVPSHVLAGRYQEPGTLAQLAALLPVPVLASPGGLPVSVDGRVVAGLGVGGPPPHVCAEIAQDALRSLS